MPGESSSPHIFISYSRADRALMERVRAALEQAGIGVWTDQGLVPGEESWKNAIEVAIRDSLGVVVILSPQSNRSQWVERELGFAMLHRVRIFPVLAAGEPGEALPIELVNAQWLDLRDQSNFEAQVQVLVRAIRSRAARPFPLPPAQPTRQPGWLPGFPWYLWLAAGLLLLVGSGLIFLLLKAAIPANSPQASPSQVAIEPPATASLWPDTATALPSEAPASTPTRTATAIPEPTQTAPPSATPLPADLIQFSLAGSYPLNPMLRLLPNEIRPAEDVYLAGDQIKAAWESQAYQHWPYLNTQAWEPQSGFMLRVQGNPLNQSWATFSNQVRLQLSMRPVGEHINAVAFTDGGAGAEYYSFEAPVPLRAFDETYLTSARFAGIDYFSVQPGESFYLIFNYACTAPGIYTQQIEINYEYGQEAGTLQLADLPVLVCPQSYSLWYWGWPLIFQVEEYRWNGETYELVSTRSFVE